MRTNVTFRHPAPFVPVSDVEDVLSVSAIDWFISLLKRIDGLVVDSRLCQEDWGAVVCVERHGKRFWIGLSPSWTETGGAWLAHLHHYPFGWLQHLGASNTRALNQFASELHDVLAKTPEISDIAWYRERDMKKSEPPAAASPNVA